MVDVEFQFEGSWKIEIRLYSDRDTRLLSRMANIYIYIGYTISQNILQERYTLSDIYGHIYVLNNLFMRDKTSRYK